MIERQLLGEYSLKIDGFDTSKLAERICRECKVISIYRRDDTLYLTVFGKSFRKVKELVEQENAVMEIIGRRGIIFILRKYFRRYGIFAGVILIAAAVFLLSNFAMKIEVNGASDEVIRREILGILSEEGLKPGCFIPSQDFLQLSNTVFSRVDGVSWASIGHSGSVVTVNVSMVSPKSDSNSNRIPCSIVASRDAVVKNASVRVGKLEVLLGDAVSKGQLLVSGIIESLDGTVRYYSSNADIIGQYEQSAVFFQPFCEEVTEYGEKLSRRGFKFFDLEIPLPGDVLRNGAIYSENITEKPVKLFNLTMPFTIVTHEFTEANRTIKNLTEGEARFMLYKKLDNYEKNILKNEKIISRDIAEVITDDGVGLSASYILEGLIGETREIFIK